MNPWSYLGFSITALSFILLISSVGKDIRFAAESLCRIANVLERMEERRGVE